MNAAILSSDREDWPTPPALVARAASLLGVEAFDLDVCARADNAKAERWIGPSDDALGPRSWLSYMPKGARNVAWMNPPYGRKVAGFCWRAQDEAQRNGITVVGLVAARVDTAWFQSFCLSAAHVYLIAGRIRFVGAPHAAPFPSALVVWRGWAPRVLSPIVDVLKLSDAEANRPPRRPRRKGGDRG